MVSGVALRRVMWEKCRLQRSDSSCGIRRFGYILEHGLNVLDEPTTNPLRRRELFMANKRELGGVSRAQCLDKNSPLVISASSNDLCAEEIWANDEIAKGRSSS